MFFFKIISIFRWFVEGNTFNTVPENMYEKREFSCLI